MALRTWDERQIGAGLTSQEITVPLLESLTAGPYNIALVIAATVGVTLAYRHGRAEGQPALALVVLLGAALAGGLIGSKFLFFDLQPAEYGEKTILGGLLLGLISVAVVARGLGLGVRRSFDRLIVPTLVAMAIGRVGCFLTGCCLGIESPHLPWQLHPVTLYEAALDLALVAFVTKRVPLARSGLRIGVGLGGYAVIRFTTEFLRAGREIHGVLNTVQWFMLAAVLMASVYAWNSATATRAPGSLTRGAVSRAAGRAPLAAAAMVALLLIALNAPVRWFTPLEVTMLLGVTTAVVVTGLRTTLSTVRRWRFSPAMGALVLLQPSAQENPRPRAVLIGGSLWRGSYERIIGESTVDGCTQLFTNPRHVSGEQYTIALRSPRLPVGQTIVEGAFLTGADRPADPADEAPFRAPTIPVRAGGLSFTSEGPRGMLRLRGVLGATSEDSGAISGITGSATLRLRMRVGLLFEGHVTPGSHYGTLGEVSYVGIGFQRRPFGARALVGVGGVFQLHVPIRQRFELDLSTRSSTDVFGKETWRVGLKHVIPLR